MLDRVIPSDAAAAGRCIGAAKNQLLMQLCQQLGPWLRGLHLVNHLDDGGPAGFCGICPGAGRCVQLLKHCFHEACQAAGY